MLDVETDAYIHCVSAFVKLAQSEYQLLVEVIPEHHQKKTFDSLIQVLPRPARASQSRQGSTGRAYGLWPPTQPPPPPASGASVLTVCLVSTSPHPSGRPHHPLSHVLALRMHWRG